MDQPPVSALQRSSTSASLTRRQAKRVRGSRPRANNPRGLNGKGAVRCCVQRRLTNKRDAVAVPKPPPDLPYTVHQWNPKKDATPVAESRAPFLQYDIPGWTSLATVPRAPPPDEPYVVHRWNPRHDPAVSQPPAPQYDFPPWRTTTGSTPLPAHSYRERVYDRSASESPLPSPLPHSRSTSPSPAPLNLPPLEMLHNVGLFDRNKREYIPGAPPNSRFTGQCTFSYPARVSAAKHAKRKAEIARALEGFVPTPGASGSGSMPRVARAPKDRASLTREKPAEARLPYPSPHIRKVEATPGASGSRTARDPGAVVAPVVRHATTLTRERPAQASWRDPLPNMRQLKETPGARGSGFPTDTVSRTAHRAMSLARWIPIEAFSSRDSSPNVKQDPEDEEGWRRYLLGVQKADGQDEEEVDQLYDKEVDQLDPSDNDGE